MATIEKRGDSYRITVSVGYNADGSQQRKRMTWKPPQNMTARQIEKELNRQATLFEEGVKSGEYAAPSSVKFQALADEWLHTLELQGELKARTMQRYRSYADRTYKALGSKRIDRISTHDIQLFINNLGEKGVKQKRNPDNAPEGLSPKTIRGYLSFVSGVFKYARSLGTRSNNPCDGVTLPSLKKPEHKYYTREEAQRFLQLLQNEPLQYQVFFNLAFSSGARRAELLGLEWRDIDFANNIIHIERNSLYTPEKGIFTDTTKTDGSNRVLKLSRNVFDLLAQYKQWQDKQRSDMGDQWHDCGRLFTKWNGSPMHPNTPATWLKRFCERTGQRYVNIHGFRHTNASLLINSNVDVRTVSAALGHSNTTTTLNIYTHEYKESQAKAAAALGDILYSSQIG